MMVFPTQKSRGGRKVGRVQAKIIDKLLKILCFRFDFQNGIFICKISHFSVFLRGFMQGDAKKSHSYRWAFWIICLLPYCKNNLIKYINIKAHVYHVIWYMFNKICMVLFYINSWQVKLDVNIKRAYFSSFAFYHKSIKLS